MILPKRINLLLRVITVGACIVFALPMLGAKNQTGSGTTRYTVKKGDTLYSIARRYKVDVDDIIKRNNLSASKPLYVGKTLIIAKAGTKTAASVKQKDGSSGTSTKSTQSKQVVNRNLHFSWPVKTVTRVERDGTDGVNSIGIVIRTAPGTAVYSAEEGTIEKIGYMRGFGNYVVMRHEERYMTVYANLDRIAVKDGQSVNKGMPIGRISQKNNSIHFQINCAGKAMDALAILPPRR